MNSLLAPLKYTIEGSDNLVMTLNALSKEESEESNVNDNEQKKYADTCGTETEKKVGPRSRMWKDISQNYLPKTRS